MASVIKAGNATDGVQVTSDNTGILELKTGTGAGTTAMTVDTSQNVGLGVTPSAWVAGSRALDIGTRGTLVDWSATQQTDIWSNGYFNGTNSIYKTNGNASVYRQASGQHQWFNAASGTAGNTIAFTQAMTLGSNGRLGIGTTSPTNLLDVSGVIGKDYTSNVTVPNNGVSTAVLNAFNGQHFSNWLQANFSPGGGGRFNGFISIDWDTGNGASGATFAFSKIAGFNGVNIAPLSVTNYNGSTTVSGNIIHISNSGMSSFTPVFKVIVTSSN